MRNSDGVIKMREQHSENDFNLTSHYETPPFINNGKASTPPRQTVPRSVSLLMPIQKTVQHFASLLANVLHLEVEVVDSHLIRIAGTGPYGENFGQVPESNTLLLQEVLEKKQEVVIFNSRQNILCQSCEQRESCRERGFIGVPIIYQQHCLGVISLVAINNEQLRHLREHTRMFIEYIRHISTLLADNLSVAPKKEPRLDSLLYNLCQEIDQGVIICDRQQRIVLINPPALALLHTSENYLHQPVMIQAIPSAPDSEAHQNSEAEQNNELYQNNEPCQDNEQHYLIAIGEFSWQVAGKLKETLNGQMLILRRGQNASQRQEVKTPLIKNLIGESAGMKKLQKLISRIASSPSSVMIMGESGTGKEVVARAIHRLSPRHDKPFVAINCAAIPESLLESELFGYVKGAFTGAAPAGKRGLIQMANGGTLFLDEIGDMPLGLQARLLRAIENREVMPIGASHPLPVDIRILSATHQHLENNIREGRFREDLYYRLNVIPLYLPPLREREGDIELLLDHFLTWHARRVGRQCNGVSREVVNLLCRHRWPGNVRELSNLVEYLINIVPEGEIIDSSLLPPVFHSCYTSGVPQLSSSQPAPSQLSSSQPAPSQLSPSQLPPSQLSPSQLPPSQWQPSPCCPPQYAGAQPVASHADNTLDHNASNLKSVEKTLIEEALQRTRNKKAVADELGIGVATLYRKIKKYGL